MARDSTSGDADRGWKAWLSHAFAVEKPEDLDPTPQQREIVDRLCREIVRRRMTAPALMTLEMSRPLNTFTASAMHLFQPIIAVVADPAAYDQFAMFLEHRGSIDYLCSRIEHHERARQEGTSPDATTGDALPPDVQRTQTPD